MMDTDRERKDRPNGPTHGDGGPIGRGRRWC